MTFPKPDMLFPSGNRAYSEHVILDWLAANHTHNYALHAAAPELYKALMDLRSFMWSEGYADQTAAMAQADRAIAKAEVTA